MGEFKSKVALITGAGRGIGFELSKLLASEGASVVLTDVNEAWGKNAVKSINDKNSGADIRFKYLDVTKPESCNQVVDEIVKEFGRLDLLGHCAGVLRTAPIIDTPEKDIHFQIDVNLKGTLFILQPVGRQMLLQKSGKICAIASQLGKVAAPTLAAYSASKFGVIGVVQAAAKEWGRQGVYVNCVCPGAVDTEMLRTNCKEASEVKGTSLEEQIRRNEEMSILGRLLPPENIVKTMLFLLSDASSEIMGQAVNCCGGRVFH